MSFARKEALIIPCGNRKRQDALADVFKINFHFGSLLGGFFVFVALLFRRFFLAGLCTFFCSRLGPGFGPAWRRAIVRLGGRFSRRRFVAGRGHLLLIALRS